ncbi:MAG: hypothetical protein ACLGIA_06785 [Actinomycetes bacterium]
MATLSALLSLVLAWTVLLPASSASAEGTPVTYKGFVYPAAATASPSADKPQSKLWYTDGAWWGLLASPSGAGVNIFELRSDHTWRDTGVVVDNRLTSTGDALWENGKLYVASRVSSGALRLYRFSYSSANRSYTRDSGFPVTIANGGTETITVARDNTGRLWTTWTQASTVYMSYSTTSDTTWAAPIAVPVSDVSVAADDISAVIAFGGSVGIMWSDQASNAFRFAVHSTSAAPDTQWTMETALDGTRFADDHMNLKSLLVDDNNRVHAAIKTSRGDSSSDSPSDPLIMVLSRTSSGTWSNATVAQVSSGLTRPQLALDSTNKDMYVLMTTEGGGQAYYKKTSLSNISFNASGTGATFMSATGAKINNISTTKDPVNSTTGLVAIASDTTTRTYYHAEMSLGGGGGTGTTASFVGAGTGSTNGSTSVVVSRPAGVAAGNVMVAGLTVRGTPTVTAPSGWTLVRNDVNGTAIRQAVYVRVAGASEPTSYTWGLSQSKAAVGQILGYAGVSTSNPVDVSGAQVRSSSTNITSPSVTTTAAGALVLRLNGITKATTVTPPSQNTERADVATTGASSPVTGESADRSQAAAGATGAATAVAGGSGSSIGQTVALRPAG